MVNWNHDAINSLVANWTNQHAQRLDTIAQGYIGGAFETSVTQAEGGNLSASIVGPDLSLRAEYGDARTEPNPWGLPSLMEASVGGMNV